MHRSSLQAPEEASSELFQENVFRRLFYLWKIMKMLFTEKQPRGFARTSSGTSKFRTVRPHKDKMRFYNQEKFRNWKWKKWTKTFLRKRSFIRPKLASSFRRSIPVLVQESRSRLFVTERPQQLQETPRRSEASQKSFVPSGRKCRLKRLCKLTCIQNLTTEHHEQRPVDQGKYQRGE